MTSIIIRNVTDVATYNHFQELQRLVWGSPPVDIMPTHVTAAVVKSGGGLVCAFAEDGPEELDGMVGGAFWWLGVGTHPDDVRGSEPRLKAASHMAGVLPAWQSQGIGARLKLAQREIILAQGLTDWMTWTYDPLYRRNAVFNIRRLGATACTFDRDHYGELPDELNAGWPSDRLTVDWRLNSPDILQDADSPRPEVIWNVDEMHVPEVKHNDAGFPVPPEVETEVGGQAIALPIPSDMDVIRKRDAALAMAWRLYMREALETALGAGYVIVDCVLLTEYGWRYVLVRER